ncbi:Gfo/Idh/MocA family protein [Paraburkholderia youngii]|uniref:Gfo/Idh/MocA family protein n=1 Tax=Paraburkholderia youngii TaxID=2782701 RepID=UPI003D1BC40C
MTRRIGIIGANWSLKVHGSAWRLLPDVEVAAVCTAHRETAEAAAKAFGVPRAYWDVADLVADPTLDIIDVGSRPSYRYDMVMAALNAGKHVYDALPFAVDTEHALAQSELAAKKGLVGVVDAQFRWVPAAMHMLKLVSEGFLGEPLGFNFQLLQPLRNHDGFIYPHASYPGGGVSPYKWLAESTSGGSAWRNFGSHMVLFLMPLLGRVKAATGSDTTGIKQWRLPDGSTYAPDTADLGCGALRMENGALGTIQTSWAVADGPGIRAELWGTKGRLLYVDPTFGDGISSRLYAGKPEPFEFGTAAGEWLETPEHYFAVPGTGFSKQNAPSYMVSMGWMFHDMLEAIKHERTPSPSFEEAAHAHRVVEAVIESGRSGRWIEIADR